MSSVYYDNSANEAIQRANEQLGRAFFDYADLRQRQKAMEIQQALEQQRLAQQTTRDQEAAAMNKARLEAQQQYNNMRLQTQQAADKARSDAAAAKQAEAETKRKQADSARAAQQGYVDQYGSDADKAYFAAFGKLPASHDPARHTTARVDPQARKVKAQLDALDDQYRYWSAQKKDAENAGERDPDASDTEQRAKKGKEDQYRNAVKNMMSIEAMQTPLRRRAFEMAGGAMPAAPDATNPGGANPFATAAAPQAATPAVKIEDLNVPLPAGVQPFNSQGGVPGQPVPAPMPPAAPALPPAQQPQNITPQPAQTPPPPPVQFTPEQARGLLDVVAAKHGKRPDLIQQMQPAPLSLAAELKAAAFKSHADPLKARELFYDLMILYGFNPLAAPVPDDPNQVNRSPGDGQVDVRELE